MREESGRGREIKHLLYAGDKMSMAKSRADFQYILDEYEGYRNSTEPEFKNLSIISKIN